MGKILLFYKYVEIQYPKQILKWQRELCERLDLKGRIIIGTEGINGTLGGTEENTKNYIQEMLNHYLFNDVDFKESDGGSEYFPKLRIIIKDEIVKLGLDTKLISVKNTGKYLDPEEAHDLINKKPKELVIFDTRNNYESHVGKFIGAIVPDIKNFRDLPEYIDSNMDFFKDKEVLMYCTGGIRCERASSYLKSKNIAKEVYQIKGGIHRYIEKFPNGHFRGKNYVFDSRVTVPVNNDILGKCYICNSSYDSYTNCLNAECNKHFISCPDCTRILKNTCSKNCNYLINENKVKIRPMYKKIENSINL